VLRKKKSGGAEGMEKLPWGSSRGGGGGGGGGEMHC